MHSFCFIDAWKNAQTICPTLYIKIRLQKIKDKKHAISIVVWDSELKRLDGIYFLHLLTKKNRLLKNAIYYIYVL